MSSSVSADGCEVPLRIYKGCGPRRERGDASFRRFACAGWHPGYLQDAPGESADVVNLGYVINVVEDPAEPLGALRPLAVVRSFEADRRRGDDLLLGEQVLGPIEEVRQRERKVLHQALHPHPPCSMTRGELRR